MSTDIYIPLGIVLSHPGQFQLKAVLNGDVEEAAEALKYPKDGNPDWDYIERELKPVLLCKFGARESWRSVEVFDHDLYVSCGAHFAVWLMNWLEEHGYKYTQPEF